MSQIRQICTFSVERLWMGFAVRDVQEVIGAPETTRVPLAPAVVRGLINLRGQIVTAIDLRRLLGLPPDPSQAPPISVVVNADDGPVSLLVDAIGEVIDVDESDCQPPPETLADSIRSLLAGIYAFEGSLLLVLDAASVGSTAATRSTQADLLRIDAPSGSNPQPARNSTVDWTGAILR